MFGEDGHDEIQDKKNSPFNLCAKIDVSSGQKKVNWGRK